MGLISRVSSRTYRHESQVAKEANAPIEAKATKDASTIQVSFSQASRPTKIPPLLSPSYPKLFTDRNHSFLLQFFTGGFSCVCCSTADFLPIPKKNNISLLLK